MTRQLKFSVTDEAAAYLRWLARHVLLLKSEHDAAKHLMETRLEEIRRQHRHDEPMPGELALPESGDDTNDKD